MSNPTTSRPWHFTTTEYCNYPKVKLEDLQKEHQANITSLIEALNALGEDMPEQFRKPRLFSSTYRTREYQINVYKRKANLKQAPFTDGVFNESKVPMGSAHISGLAADLRDSDGTLAPYLASNPELLAKHGLYMEDPRHTVGWCHLQKRAPGSGNRVFIP